MALPEVLANHFMHITIYNCFMAVVGDNQRFPYINCLTHLRTDEGLMQGDPIPHVFFHKIVKRSYCSQTLGHEECPSLKTSRRSGGISPELSNLIHNTLSAWRVEIVLKSVTFIRIFAQCTGWCGRFSDTYRLKAPRMES